MAATKKTLNKEQLEIANKIEELFKEHGSISAAIRYLASEGHSRADIARITGKRYQHVRNVLVEQANKKS